MRGILSDLGAVYETAAPLGRRTAEGGSTTPPPDPATGGKPPEGARSPASATGRGLCPRC